MGLRPASLAVYRLNATTFEVGALEADEWIRAVALGLLAGALVDRHHQHCRAIMMAANLGQAAAVAAVPVTATTGALSFGVLLCAALTAGLFTTTQSAAVAPTDQPRALRLRHEIRDGLIHLRADRLLLTIAGARAGAALGQLLRPRLALRAMTARYLAATLTLMRSPLRDTDDRRRQGGATPAAPTHHDDVSLQSRASVPLTDPAKGHRRHRHDADSVS